MENKNKKKKVSIALGGGATKGMAIFGVLEKVKENNFEIGSVAGSSIGAIIGAYYALYGEVESLKKEVLTMKRKDWSKLADFNVMPKQSLIKAVYYREFLEKKFGDRKFSDTKIPLVITVTNLTTKKPEYIESGRIVDALMKSSAYPGIFPFIEEGDCVYVDGGLSDNLPYEILVKKGFKKIIAINLVNRVNNQEINNIFDVVVKSFDYMIENAFSGIGREEEKVFVIHPKFNRKLNESWRFDNLKEKYELGKREFELRKKDLLKWLEL